MIQGDQTDMLFMALAEQLKTPLLQIARLSEIPANKTARRISAISGQALRLVDAYMQAATQTQGQLLLEPVNAGAVLYDAAHALQPFAKQWDYNLQVDQVGRSMPVMAHGNSLRTMLILLGASLIETGLEEDNTKRQITLGTHRTAHGTVIGAFSKHIPLSQRALQLTRELHGRAAQAVPSLGLAGGAGIAIADRLSYQLSAPLKAYRHQSLSGIGSLLSLSKQLQLLR